MLYRGIVFLTYLNYPNVGIYLLNTGRIGGMDNNPGSKKLVSSIVPLFRRELCEIILVAGRS